MKPRPSEYFLGAILRGYNAERRDHPDKPVEARDIWDHIAIECMGGRRGSFEAMFEWDTRKSKQNRIMTIIEVIEDGWVPCNGGKRLDTDLSPKGRISWSRSRIHRMLSYPAPSIGTRTGEAGDEREKALALYVL